MEDKNKPEAPAGSQADTADNPLTEEEKSNLLKQEEQKLKAKYPQVNRIPPHASGAGGGGHSAFLQKRLAKGQKYFDSGDYNMAKQRPRAARLAMPVLSNQPPTGDTIPTPELVPARKTSIIQPLHDHSQLLHVDATPEPGKPIPNPAVTKLAS